MRESALVRKIMKAVRERYPHAFVVKLADRCTRGLPDLMLLWNGEFLFVETKSSNGVLSAIQLEVHRKIHVAGGRVLIAWSVNEVLSYLERA